MSGLKSRKSDVGGGKRLIRGVAIGSIFGAACAFVLWSYQRYRVTGSTSSTALPGWSHY